MTEDRGRQSSRSPVVHHPSSVVSHGTNLFRYSGELTKPSTIRRESAGFVSKALIQSVYKLSGSRCRYPKYSITTNAWL